MKYLEHDSYDIGKIYDLTIINNIPKPVDTTSGLSVCSWCGSKYAGKMEGNCFNVVPFINLPDDFRQYQFLLKNVVEDAKTSSSAKNRLTNGKVIYKECGHTRFYWDLQSTQDEYNEFIRFLNSLSSHISNYAKFKQYLTPKTNALLLDSLPDRVLQLEQQNHQMREAINEIANKINSAGDCLSF